MYLGKFGWNSKCLQQFKVPLQSRGCFRSSILHWSLEKLWFHPTTFEKTRCQLGRLYHMIIPSSALAHASLLQGYLSIRPGGQVPVCGSVLSGFHWTSARTTNYSGQRLVRVVSSFTLLDTWRALHKIGLKIFYYFHAVVAGLSKNQRTTEETQSLPGLRLRQYTVPYTPPQTDKILFFSLPRIQILLLVETKSRNIKQ